MKRKALMLGVAAAMMTAGLLGSASVAEGSMQGLQKVDTSGGIAKASVLKAQKQALSKHRTFGSTNQGGAGDLKAQEGITSDAGSGTTVRGDAKAGLSRVVRLSSAGPKKVFDYYYILKAVLP